MYVATNGVVSEPRLQWSGSLVPPDWQPLTPVSASYPATATNGHYEIIAVLPESSIGYLQVIQGTLSQGVDFGAPLLEMGERVATTSRVAAVEARLDTVEGWGDHAQAGYATTTEVAAVSNRVDAIEAWPAATFEVSGTNLLWISGGVTNRVVMEVY